MTTTNNEAYSILQSIADDCDIELWDELDKMDDGDHIRVDICVCDLKRVRDVLAKSYKVQFVAKFETVITTVASQNSPEFQDLLCNIDIPEAADVKYVAESFKFLTATEVE